MTTVHTLRPFYRIGFYRSGVFHISDILCTSAVIRHYAKNDNSPFKCHLFSRVFEFMEARKTCHWVVWTSIWLIYYSGELWNKKCIVKTSETLIIWSASYYTAGSGRWEAIKEVPDRRLKRSSDGLGYTIDTLNWFWPIDVHSQQWLLIF